MLCRRIAVLLLLVLTVIALSTSAFAISEMEKTFLSMYFTDEELQIVSATRSLKSITRVAENVEVVTAADMELMNAHTVAEALVNVTGIAMVGFVGPGAQGLPEIHGSDWTRTAVFLDGVPLMGAANAVATGILPVQMIDRIEIIKGPASSTWGSSFGGVVNIITKSVKPGDHLGGTLYAAGGERNTSDARAELYGRKGNIGVYLYSGTMNSSGLRSSHEFWHNNFFSKIVLDAGRQTKLDLSFLYHRSDSVQFDFLPLGADAYRAFGFENLFGRVALQTALRSDLDLNASVWMISNRDLIYENTVSTEDRLFDSNDQFARRGLNANLTWRPKGHTIVAGTDVSRAKLRLNIPSVAVFENRQRRYAFFINDTIIIDKLSMTPGLRYDDANLGDEIWSPSLGMTYLLTEDIILKASVARGFFDPSISDFIFFPGLESEKIWSYQVGAEANIAHAFWAKLVLFRHDIDDIISDASGTRVNGGKQRTYGGEVSVKTSAYKGFVFEGGFSYERIKLLNFNDPSLLIFNDPRLLHVTKRYGIDTSISYDNGKGLRGILKGHYLWWNLTEFWGAKYNGFVVDFNVIKELLKKKDTSLDIFMTAHNIFDAASYNDILTMNPPRWVEAGLRFKF